MPKKLTDNQLKQKIQSKFEKIFKEQWVQSPAAKGNIAITEKYINQEIKKYIGNNIRSLQKLSDDKIAQKAEEWAKAFIKERVGSVIEIQDVLEEKRVKEGLVHWLLKILKKDHYKDNTRFSRKFSNIALEEIIKEEIDKIYKGVDKIHEVEVMNYIEEQADSESKFNNLIPNVLKSNYSVIKIAEELHFTLKTEYGREIEKYILFTTRTVDTVIEEYIYKLSAEQIKELINFSKKKEEFLEKQKAFADQLLADLKLRNDNTKHTNQLIIKDIKNLPKKVKQIFDDMSKQTVNRLDIEKVKKFADEIGGITTEKDITKYFNKKRKELKENLLEYIDNQTFKPGINEIVDRLSEVEIAEYYCIANPEDMMSFLANKAIIFTRASMKEKYLREYGSKKLPTGFTVLQKQGLQDLKWVETLYLHNTDSKALGHEFDQALKMVQNFIANSMGDKNLNKLLKEQEGERKNRTVETKQMMEDLLILTSNENLRLDRINKIKKSVQKKLENLKSKIERGENVQNLKKLEHGIDIDKIEKTFANLEKIGILQGEDAGKLNTIRETLQDIKKLDEGFDTIKTSRNITSVGIKDQKSFANKILELLNSLTNDIKKLLVDNKKPKMNEKNIQEIQTPPLTSKINQERKNNNEKS